MALSFDGINDRIDYPSVHTPVGGPFSFACRFSLSAASENEYFLLVESGVSDFGLTIWLRDDAGQQGLAVTCSGANASVLRYSAPQALVIDIWYDLIVTWDGNSSASNIHIYLNGTELNYVTSTDGAAPLRAQDGNWIIAGRAIDNLRNFSGRLADVGAWNVILSEAQRAMFNAGQPPARIQGASLVFDARFVGGNTIDAVTLNSGLKYGNPQTFGHPTNIVAINSLAGTFRQTVVSSNDSPLPSTVNVAAGAILPSNGQSVFSTVLQVASSITVEDNFEGGNTDIGRVQIANTSSVSPLITLYARPNRNIEGNSPSQIYYSLACRLTGVSGKAPTFRFNLTDENPNSIYGAGGWPADWRAWFSYDQLSWQRLSNSSVVGNFQEVSGDSVFTEDTVYIATRLPYNPSRVNSHTDAIMTNSVVSEPASSLGKNFIYGQSATTTRDGDGVVVPALNLISYRISNDASGPIDGTLKRKAVLISGQHASEDQGNWQLEAFVNFLLNDSVIANELLRDWEFFVYPMVNPSGRWGNAYRGTLQEGQRGVDPNRDWPGGSASGRLQVVSATRLAIEQDTGNRITAFIDFHGRLRETDSIFRFPNSINDSFVQSVNARHPVNSVVSSAAEGIAETYYRTALGVPLSVTSEGSAVVTSVSEYALLGEAIAKALNDCFREGLFHSHSLSVSGAFQVPNQLANVGNVENQLAQISIAELWLS